MPRPLLLLLAATVLVAPACRGTTSDSDAVEASHPPPRTGSLVMTGSGPVGLTVDSQGSVWVANVNAGTVNRLNANGDQTDLTRQVGAAPLRLAATGGGVWVSVFSDGTIRRVDEETGRVTATVRVGAEPEGLTAAFGSIWVVLQASAEVLRVNPTSGKISDRYAVGRAPRLITSGGGALWVSDFESGRVLRIDPKSGKVRASGPLCDGPQGMLSSPRTLWVACTTGNVLVAIDPTTLRESSRLALPGSPDSIAAGPHGQLLVALQKGPTLAVIDPQASSVVRRLTLGRQNQLNDSANIDLVYTRGHAWISSYLDDGIYLATP